MLAKRRKVLVISGAHEQKRKKKTKHQDVKRIQKKIQKNKKTKQAPSVSSWKLSRNDEESQASEHQGGRLMMIDKHRLRLPPTRDYGAGEFPPVAPSPSV